MKRALALGPLVGVWVFTACVGDDPAPSPTLTPDSGTADGTTGDDSGGGGDGGTDSGADATREAKGDFVWALTAARGPGGFDWINDGIVGLGGGNVIGGAVSVGADASFGTQSTTGAGAAFFRMNATKDVACAARIAPPSSGSVRILATATDSAGDLYAVGSFIGGALTIGATTLPLTGTGGADFFAKLSGTTCAPIWARSLAPTGSSLARGVATRGTDVAVVFEMSGDGGANQVTYDQANGGSTTPTTVTGEGTAPDALLLFLEPSTGRTLWAKHIHGNATDRPQTVRIDGSGNVWVGGAFFSPTLKLGSDASAALTKTGDPGAGPGFVMRFDAADPHNVGFARSLAIGTAGKLGAVTAVAVAPNGDPIVCGYFESSIDFGAGAQTGNGLDDGFVARLQTGTTAPAWSVVFGGAQDDECSSVDVDPSDQVVIGVTYKSSNVKVDTRTFSPPTAGQRAGAVAKLSGSGKLLWGHDLVGSAAAVRSVVVHPSGDVLYSGSFLGTVDLGGGNVTSGASGTEPTYFVVRRGY